MKLCPSLPVCFIFNAHIIFKAYLPFCFLLKQFQDKRKTPQNFFWSVFVQVGDYLFSRAVSSELSSAQVSLTSVFGMGTGGTSPSSSPTIWLAKYIISDLLCLVFQKDVPSKLNNHCYFSLTWDTQANCGQALDLLVHACWMDRSTYTSCLSTL